MKLEVTFTRNKLNIEVSFMAKDFTFDEKKLLLTNFGFVELFRNSTCILQLKKEFPAERAEGSAKLLVKEIEEAVKRMRELKLPENFVVEI